MISDEFYAIPIDILQAREVRNYLWSYQFDSDLQDIRSCSGGLHESNGGFFLEEQSLLM